MLADVVSERSVADADTTAPRVDIEKNPSIAAKFPRRSNDRHANTTPEPSSSSHCPTSSGRAATNEDRNGKRRRLYVERESVEDALALLDRSDKVPLPSTKSHSHTNSCVCPLNRSIVN
jgi:hypothetical protein